MICQTICSAVLGAGPRRRGLGRVLRRPELFGRLAERVPPWSYESEQALDAVLDGIRRGNLLHGRVRVARPAPTGNVERYAGLVSAVPGIVVERVMMRAPPGQRLPPSWCAPSGSTRPCTRYQLPQPSPRRLRELCTIAVIETAPTLTRRDLSVKVRRSSVSASGWPMSAMRTATARRRALAEGVDEGDGIAGVGGEVKTDGRAGRRPDRRLHGRRRGCRDRRTRSTMAPGPPPEPWWTRPALRSRSGGPRCGR